jgi:hypothetical protein
MGARIKRHLTYANVVASLAMFLALGGVGYAAVKLPRNSVGNKQLKDDAVRSKEVKNGSLLKGDFKAGQLPRGAKGAPGTNGVDGHDGAPGTARAYVFVNPVCAGGPPPVACPTLRSKNIESVTRSAVGIYCVKVAGISDTTQFASMAGVDFRGTNAPEGNASAMSDSTNAALCPDDQFDVLTKRIPASAPVSGATADTSSAAANTVAFWFLVP